MSKGQAILMRMLGKRSPYSLLLVIENSKATGKVSIDISQNTKNRTTMWPSCTTSEHMPKGSRMLPEITYTSVFMAALVTVSRRWVQPRCPSTDEDIMKFSVYKQWNCIQLSRNFYENNGSENYYIN